MTTADSYLFGLREGTAMADADRASWYGCGGRELDLRQEAQNALLHSTSRPTVARALGRIRGYREIVREPFPKRDSLETATEGGAK